MCGQSNIVLLTLVLIQRPWNCIDIRVVLDGPDMTLDIVVTITAYGGSTRLSQVILYSTPGS